MRKIHIFTALLCMCCFLCSCKEYYEDLQDLGKRVVKLEDSALAFKNDLETMNKLVQAMNTYGIISNIKQNEDGSYTLEFADGREPITFINGLDGKNGENGADGKDGDALLGVKKDADGHYYWTFGDKWLRDSDGNKISAEPDDGKDGKDGEDGKDGKDGEDAKPTTEDIVLPQVKVGDNGTWEISTDGGETWDDTGVKVDGKDGKDGKDGQDGQDGYDGRKNDPVFINATVTEDYVIFVIKYGVTGETTVWIPRLK